MSDKKTRVPLLAAFLSLLVPGLGHFYGNEIGLAIRLYLFVMIAAVLVMFFLGVAFWTLILSLVGLLGLVLFVCVDAFRRSARVRLASRSRYQHPLVYLFIIAMHAFAVAPLLKSVSPYRAYRIPTSSMSPILEAGDYIMARKTPGGFHKSGRGQVVVLAHPRVPGATVIKRIVGLEGETVETRERSVIVNDRVLEESYVAPGVVSSVHDSEPVVIPEGTVFVVGDNRGNSEDSRHFGPVPRTSIEALARYAYWSRDIRRFGKKIQ